MTDGNSVEQLSVVMTTETATDVTETTAANVKTSSPSSRAIEVSFQCAVVVIGVVGTAANALILYAMVASKQHKKHALIFHQNTLDFFTCLVLVITYVLKLCNIHLTGSVGYWLCMLILSENLLWCVGIASKINLVCLTIERYLKVVYPVWSKNKLRNWMLYSAMAFAWIGGFVHQNTLAFSTSDVVDGLCYAYVFWKSRQSQMACGVLTFLLLYANIVILLIFCYGRILISIRRQAKAMASYNAAVLSTTQVQSHRIQTNVVKTMILVSASYAICDMPIFVYYLLMSIRANLTLLYGGYYASLFIFFFYICANPFIYAVKFDPVKQILLRMIPCKKTPVQLVGSVELASSHLTAARSAQERNTNRTDVDMNNT